MAAASSNAAGAGPCSMPSSSTATSTASREGRRTLGDLCCLYGIEIGNAHDAWSDAIASAEVLFALAARYEALSECDLAQLHENQARWHREWAQSYDGWRISQGKIPIDPRDYEWPVVPVALPPAA